MERPWNSEDRKVRELRATLSGGIPWTGCQYSCTHDATINNIQPQGRRRYLRRLRIPLRPRHQNPRLRFHRLYGLTVNTETNITISPKPYTYDLNADMANDFLFAYVRDDENRSVLAIADNPSPQISVRWKYQKH